MTGFTSAVFCKDQCFSADCGISHKLVPFQALDNIIGNSPYQYVTTNHWTKQVVETITTSLVKLNKPYKYIGKLFVVVDESVF